MWYIYEGESVNRSQLDIKSKTWYSNLEKTFISWHILHQHWYTVPSLYQCVETRSIEVFWLLSQPLPHLRFIICDFRTSFREFLAPCDEPLYATNTIKRKHLFLLISFALSPLAHKTSTRELCCSVVYYSSMVVILTTETSLWRCACASATDCDEAGLCCYIVIHTRQPITSMTAVLLPFLIYLLTPPRSKNKHGRRGW
jgi:hypothetical protein